MAKQQAKPDADWRGGPSLSERQAFQKSSRWLAAMLALALLVLFVCLLWRRPAPTTMIATLAVEGSDLLTVAPIEFQSETLQDIAQLPDYVDKFVLQRATRVNDLKEWIANPSQNGAGVKDCTLIVYISGHGFVKDGAARLICGDFSLKGGGTCSVAELLDAVQSSQAAKKLVVLDTGRLAYDPRLGVILNDFPLHLDKASHGLC